jgi:AcrR family transcriptional regulator
MEDQPGLRERKRQETRQRIIDAGLRLFSTKGFVATTLDAIAAEAGISRRTVFNYFSSKDDILLSVQTGLGAELIAALEPIDPSAGPFTAMRAAMERAVGRYSLEELIAIDRMMRSSEAVQSRKQASYLHDEGLIATALARHFPDASEISLRLVAMLSIGIARLALDAWYREGSMRTLAAVLAETLDAMDGLT